MFERPQSGERAALIQVDIGKAPDAAVVEEFHLLAKSAGAEIVWAESFSRAEPEPKFFIGKGQAEMISDAVKAHKIELVIFNARLSPSQERNLEKLFQTRVLDRSGLVLDIFAQRARSHEGKLQVELAQLNHLSTRLVRGWTHLERQKGGIGLRGPGETQLETDRRLLAVRIKQLKKKLEKVERQRFETRKSRERQEMPTVALAGYTNAGKSTLFNVLTDADVLAKDQLFATLDPTWRKLVHSNGQTILMADTVGFVSDLPHELVAAFKSTLEETAYADLVLQVIDYADPERQEREQVVEQVLEEIGALEVPMIRVFNKIDLRDESPRVLTDEQGNVHSVFVSAYTEAGIDLLKEAIIAHFAKNEHRGWLHLTPAEGALRAELFKNSAVLEEQIQPDGSMDIHVVLGEVQLRRLESQYQRTLDLQLEQTT
ncbi:ribosome rescue GTPase HflX [Suttonella ornithocola]|uniref:GTPase HflX n=1 Tax=Suttonella ornithocola TaxID=279832 RepID=A0A380ML69_9GAMM|nr:ribosome rescue GTPase HflX [Suttonella ornithocola]SUO93389.1 GTP-binding protein HflX [Suttonella ornithocola]